MQRIYRPTALGLALINAVAKVYHTTVKPDNWVARRIVMQANNTKLGITSEPAVNARLSFRTANMLKQQGVIS